MNLNTTDIKVFGDRLYRRLLSNKTLSDDTCSEAFNNFMKRLKAFRDKHPEAESVSPRFVRNCERWITADLLRKKQRRRTRAAVEIELSKQDLTAPQAVRGSGNTFLFLKLETFLKSWIRKKPKARRYARIFLLSNAWYLSPRRVRLFAPLADGKKSDFVKQVKAVREYVDERFSAAVRERVTAAQYWHWQSVRNDVKAREETGSRCRTLKQRKADYLEKHRRAVLSLEKLKLKPPVNVLAKIAGVTAEQARYACAMCLKEMRKG